MPKSANTPQITTPVPRAMKQAWDVETTRLRYSGAGVAYPGDLQKGLIALFLAEPEKARDEIAAKAIAAYHSNWGRLGGSVTQPARRKLRGYAAGTTKIERDGSGNNSAVPDVSLPKRRK